MWHQKDWHHILLIHPGNLATSKYLLVIFILIISSINDFVTSCKTFIQTDKIESSKPQIQFSNYWTSGDSVSMSSLIFLINMTIKMF